MNWKRGIIIAIVLWVLIFFEVSILMFGFKLSAPSLNYYIIHYLLLTILIIVLSWIYFNGKKVKKGVIEGIVLGIIFVIVGIILDSIITIPLFVKDWGFSFKPEMLAGYVLIIVLNAIIGLIRGIKR